VLSAFILGQTTALVDYVQRSCGGDSDISLYQVLDKYPNRHHLVRLLNAYSPKVVFLEIDASGTALSLARDIQTASPETSLIGYAQKLGFEQLQQATAAGIPEVLQGYFTSDALQRALARAIESGRLREGHNTIAFVSAKGGSGATTVALNVAGKLAKHFNKSLLLVEGDLHSGPLSVMLDLNPESSIAEALGMSESIDDTKWSAIVSNAQGIDVLPAPRDGRIGDFTAWDGQRLLSFAAARYDTVLVDLPDVISELTAPVVNRADHVYVVCTAEMASLFMAQRRLLELESLGVPADRLGVVVNRHGESDVQIIEIEKYLETPVFLTLPDDAASIRQAGLSNGLIDDHSPLGQRIVQFASQITGEKPAERLAARPSLVRNVLGVFDRRLGKAHT
jgi:pilus assembly protein CpaE